MTQTRRHIAGQLAMLTRRCSGRRHSLCPDEFIHAYMPFEIGKSANRYGPCNYVVMAMSHHVHLAVGDSTADRSKYTQDVMSGIVRTPSNSSLTTT